MSISPYKIKITLIKFCFWHINLRNIIFSKCSTKFTVSAYSHLLYHRLWSDRSKFTKTIKICISYWLKFSDFLFCKNIMNRMFMFCLPYFCITLLAVSLYWSSKLFILQCKTWGLFQNTIVSPSITSWMKVPKFSNFGEIS